MTAEWENTLMEIERGNADADAFLSGIVQMTEAPRNDVIAALHIAVLSGRCAQNLCDGLGNAGLFSND